MCAVHTRREELRDLERSPREKENPAPLTETNGFHFTLGLPPPRSPLPSDSPAWFTGLQCGNPWFMAAEWRAREWCASKPPDHGRFPLFYYNYLDIPFYFLFVLPVLALPYFFFSAFVFVSVTYLSRFVCLFVLPPRTIITFYLEVYMCVSEYPSLILYWSSLN